MKTKSILKKPTKKERQQKREEKITNSVYFEDNENDERYEYNEIEGVYVLKKDINDDTIEMNEDDDRRK